MASVRSMRVLAASTVSCNSSPASFRQGLIGGEENVLCGLQLAANARAGVAKGAKLVVHRLSQQPVTIGQEQDILDRLHMLQLPDDLESDLCLAGPGGQGHEDAR